MTQQDEDLYWLTATVLQEAGGEPAEGKLGVAYSIMNRVHSRKKRVPEIVLAPWQYSCYNTTSPTRRMIVTRSDATWKACELEALRAYQEAVPDPTFGSTHYLNPRVLPKLPAWYRKELVRAVLGAHHFLQVD
jgi:spore germination cell wall hydrolase CwlJ-like protein